MRDLPERIQGLPEGAPRLSSGGASSAPAPNLNLEKMEKAFIEQALRLTDGNVTDAARMLGISRRTLHRKIKTYRMEPK